MTVAHREEVEAGGGGDGDREVADEAEEMADGHEEVAHGPEDVADGYDGDSPEVVAHKDSPEELADEDDWDVAEVAHGDGQLRQPSKPTKFLSKSFSRTSSHRLAVIVAFPPILFVSAAAAAVATVAAAAAAAAALTPPATVSPELAQLLQQHACVRRRFLFLRRFFLLVCPHLFFRLRDFLLCFCTCIKHGMLSSLWHFNFRQHFCSFFNDFFSLSSCVPKCFNGFRRKLEVWHFLIAHRTSNRRNAMIVRLLFTY